MHSGKDKQEIVSKHDRFTHMILRVIKADSVQAKQIKPLMEAAASKIDELEKGSNEKMASIMDSLKLNLQPILTPEQFQRLNDFDAKAKNHWRGRGQREMKKQ
jgi:Spy/CpxP family protein refolding chaperone